MTPDTSSPTSPSTAVPVRKPRPSRKGVARTIYVDEMAVTKLVTALERRPRATLSSVLSQVVAQLAANDADHIGEDTPLLSTQVKIWI